MDVDFMLNDSLEVRFPSILVESSSSVVYLGRKT